MFPLVETIRYENGHFHNLELHEDRLNRSREELFPSSKPISLNDELIQPDTVNPSLTYKVRVIYGERVGYIEWLPYHFKMINTIKLVKCDTIDYHLKYRNRSELNRLTSENPEADTVLIVKDGYITDSTFCNVLFWDGTNWITPKTPLLNGIQREHLLKEGKIIEQDIRLEDLDNYFSIQLINAMIPQEISPILPMTALLK